MGEDLVAELQKQPTPTKAEQQAQQHEVSNQALWGKVGNVSPSAPAANLARASDHSLLLRIDLGSHKKVEKALELLRNAEQLDLNSCHNITDAGLLACLASLHQLQYLDLSASECITDKGLTSISSLHQLQFLTLPGHITDKGVAFLQQLHVLDLRSWNPYQSSQLTDASLVKIGSLKQLRYLYLDSCHITNTGLASITFRED